MACCRLIGKPSAIRGLIAFIVLGMDLSIVQVWVKKGVRIA
jgi:hypothetical protein